jgi:hypothetical protein
MGVINMNFRDGGPASLGWGSGAGPKASDRFNLEQIVVLGFETWWVSPSKVAEDHIAEDVIFLNHCPPHLSAFGGAHVGRTAMVESFKRFAAEFLMTQPCVTSILTDGFHVAVGWSVMLRHIGTGRSGQINGMAHITLGEDMRIRRIESFFDTARVAEVGEMLEGFAARSEALDFARRASFSGRTKNSSF